MADDSEPRTASEPGPRIESAHRRRAVGAARPTPAPTVARTEPVIAIEPPARFRLLSVAWAAVMGTIGLGTAVANAADGNVVDAAICLVGGMGLALMAYDASVRYARSDGDVLELRQWFRTVTLHRAEIDVFEAQRGSFVRWDIVAVPKDGVQVRLWVTRMLPAGRRTRQAWLTELEAWRTWIGPPGS